MVDYFPLEFWYLFLEDHFLASRKEYFWQSSFLQTISFSIMFENLTKRKKRGSGTLHFRGKKIWKRYKSWVNPLTNTPALKHPLPANTHAPEGIYRKKTYTHLPPKKEKHTSPWRQNPQKTNRSPAGREVCSELVPQVKTF